MTLRTIADDAREYDRVFHASFSAARAVRARLVTVRPHRALTPLSVTPWLLAQAVVLPLVLCGLLLWARPWLQAFWRLCFVFWAGLLGERLPTGTPLPGRSNLVITAAVCLLGLALSLRIKGAALPLKYAVRIVCSLQLLAVLYFWLAPSGFPYSIGRHSEQLMTTGWVVMLATPVLLAMGYYILNQSFWIKLGHTALILGFLAVLVPHQVLAQALILQHLSVLFMPVLSLCFGAVFDALVFVALYSWAASDAPADATR
jgi:hypothetical protein